MPKAFRDIDLAANRHTSLPVDELIESESVAQGTGSNIIVVLFILKPEHHTGHLLERAGNSFESCRQGEITKRFLFINKEWEMFVRWILLQLCQHRPFREDRSVGNEGRQQGRHFIENDFPIARFSRSRHGAAKSGRRFVRIELAEIQCNFRSVQSPCQGAGYETKDSVEHGSER